MGQNERTWNYLPNFGRPDPSSIRKCAAKELTGAAYRWVKLGDYTFSTVNNGLAFTFGARNWCYYPLDVEPGNYEVWLSARFDETTGTLFVERLVAVSAPGA